MKLREDEELLRRDDYKRYKELRALPLSHAKAIEMMVLGDYGVSKTWMIDREEGDAFRNDATGGNKKGNPCGRDLGRDDHKKLE